MPTREGRENHVYQTGTPHVEFYINDQNILTSPNGKPRTLVSFSHTSTAQGSGPFRLEVFDPEYVTIEELLLTYNLFGLQVADDIIDAEAQPDDTDRQRVLNHVIFRYGWVGQEGKSLAKPPNGGNYFAGFVTQYIPSLRTHGTNLIIEGQSCGISGADYYKKMRLDSHFFNRPIYEIIKSICEIQGWKLRGIGAYELEHLPLEYQPEVILDTQNAIEDTEETHRSIYIPPDMNPYQIVQKLCDYARPVNSKFNEFVCRLEYAVEGREPDDPKNRFKPPQGYLYFGPKDPYQEPVRRYIYMRDKDSTVISFTPTIIGTPGYLSGASGMVHKTDDVLRGEMVTTTLTELDRYLRFHTQERPEIEQEEPDESLPQTGEPQDPELAKKVEGTIHGGHVNAPADKPSPDKQVYLEMSNRGDNRYYEDREKFSYWMVAQNMVNTATLLIQGDAGRDLQVGKVVDVFIFVPFADGTFRLHYVSNRWIIVGIVHQITNGQYITSLELSKIGWHGGATGSKSFRISLQKALGEEGLKKLGQGGGNESAS